MHYTFGMLEQLTFTVDDLALMDKAGLFSDRRVELIDGVIYDYDPNEP